MKNLITSIKYLRGLKHSKIKDILLINIDSLATILHRLYQGRSIETVFKIQ